MLWFSWGYAISADGWGYLTPLFQKKCPLTRLILNRLFNWFWNIFIMTLLSLADFSHSLPVGCCISVHTFSKSPGLGLQLARDLGFLPAQHMLHSYLCELCFHVCSAVHCCILSVFHEKPAVLAECILGTKETTTRHQSCIFLLWNGTILRWFWDEQVCWCNNIWRLLINCFKCSESDFFFFFTCAFFFASVLKLNMKAAHDITDNNPFVFVVSGVGWFTRKERSL